VVRRTWRNTDGQLHRTAGPAWEEWTVLPGGGHVLSYQAWSLNGRTHREGWPANRYWHVAEDGTRSLAHEWWSQHGGGHRIGAPSFRHWTVERDGTRTVASEEWHVNGNLHRADGPAYEGRSFYSHNRGVRQEDLPWLRRGCILPSLEPGLASDDDRG